MLKLKQDPGNWEKKNFGLRDFEIENKDNQLIGVVYSKENHHTSESLVTPQEAKFNALLISKAPKMAQALIDVRQALIDRNEGNESLQTKAIDTVLEGLTDES